MKTKRTQKSEKRIFEARYQSENGIRVHTDYIVDSSELLAKRYAKRQAEAYGVELILFEEVPEQEAKNGPHSKIIELREEL